MSIHPSTYWSIFPSMDPSICPPEQSSICQSIHPPTQTSIHALIDAYRCCWRGLFVLGVGKSPHGPTGRLEHPVLLQLGAERAPLQAADKSESGTLEGEEFVLFYKALTQREEVLSLFQDFSEDGKKLTLLELVDFLQQEQLEDEGTEELAMELIDKYEPSETGECQPGHRLYRGKEGAETHSPAAGAPPAPSCCRWAQGVV